MTTSGVPASRIGPNAARSDSSADADRMPNTSLSGCSVSSTAKPSRRNSGFHATSTPLEGPPGASEATRSAIRCAVPAGTVDLPTTSAGRVSSGASVPNAACTCVRSAAYPSLDCGVPTQTKCTSANSATSS